MGCNLTLTLKPPKNQVTVPEYVTHQLKFLWSWGFKMSHAKLCCGTAFILVLPFYSSHHNFHDKKIRHNQAEQNCISNPVAMLPITLV